MMKKIITSLILAFLFAACSTKQDTSASLSLSANLNENLKIKKSKQILKIMPRASLSLNTKNIIYTQNALNYAYAKHFWQDFPANMLMNILLKKLSFYEISAISYESLANSDLLLEIYLNELRASFDKNQVELSLNANLIKENVVLAQKEISKNVNFNQSSVNSLLNAFNEAMNSSLDELILWLDLK